MGSAAFKSPEIQNKVEDDIRQKEIESREQLRINRCDCSKGFDLDRELLGAISKLNRKRKEVDSFDSIVPNEKQQKENLHQDGLVIILCKDSSRKLQIKCSLLQLLDNSKAVRWPNFRITDDQNSLYCGIREIMCNKVIGYTTFFLFYGVIPETELTPAQIELDINRTVQYFKVYHRGALNDVPQHYIFEVPKTAIELCGVGESENGTIFIVSDDEDHLQAISKVAEKENCDI